MTCARAIALVGAGLVDVSSVISHRFAIHDLEAAIRTAARREGDKVQVDPSATAPARGSGMLAVRQPQPSTKGAPE